MLIIFLYTFIVGGLSILLYQAMPFIVSYFKRVLTRKKRVSNIDCVALEHRVKALEAKIAKRYLNDRAAIREEIKNVLLDLKK
jgi:hypothetical protein